MYLVYYFQKDFIYAYLNFWFYNEFTLNNGANSINNNVTFGITILALLFIIFQKNIKRSYRD